MPSKSGKPHRLRKHVKHTVGSFLQVLNSMLSEVIWSFKWEGVEIWESACVKDKWLKNYIWMKKNEFCNGQPCSDIYEVNA